MKITIKTFGIAPSETVLFDSTLISVHEGAIETLIIQLMSVPEVDTIKVSDFDPCDAETIEQIKTILIQCPQITTIEFHSSRALASDKTHVRQVDALARQLREYPGIALKNIAFTSAAALPYEGMVNDVVVTVDVLNLEQQEQVRTIEGIASLFKENPKVRTLQIKGISQYSIESLMQCLKSIIDLKESYPELDSILIPPIELSNEDMLYFMREYIDIIDALEAKTTLEGARFYLSAVSCGDQVDRVSRYSASELLTALKYVYLFMASHSRYAVTALPHDFKLFRYSVYARAKAEELPGSEIWWWRRACTIEGFREQHFIRSTTVEASFDGALKNQNDRLLVAKLTDPYWQTSKGRDFITGINNAYKLYTLNNNPKIWEIIQAYLGTSSWLENTVAFESPQQTGIIPNGLRCHPIPGDGDCFYSAIIDHFALLGEPCIGDANVLRRIVVQTLTERLISGDTELQMLLNATKDPHQSINDFIRSIGQRKWADHLEIGIIDTYLYKQYQMQLIIVNLDGTLRHIATDYSASHEARPLFIQYNGERGVEHYNLLFPKKGHRPVDVLRSLLEKQNASSSKAEQSTDDDEEALRLAFALSLQMPDEVPVSRLRLSTVAQSSRFCRERPTVEEILETSSDAPLPLRICVQGKRI